MRLIIEGGHPLNGSIEVPADKSITHRALLFSAMAEGISELSAKRPGADNLSTAACLKSLGVDIQSTEEGWRVVSQGFKHWQIPKQPLDCGNSGTTIRLLTGILAGLGLQCELIGDASLSKRPMGRICEPLRKLGANVSGQQIQGKELLPLKVQPGQFNGGSYVLNIASAQVKSALLLAGVTSGCEVQVREPVRSRDHTERMLQGMGAELQTWDTSEGAFAKIAKDTHLQAHNVKVPGDISSAAFWLAAALMIKNSNITLQHVGLNATRTGILDVLKQLGAEYEISHEHEQGGEKVGNIQIHYQALNTPNQKVHGAIIPRLVDELMVIAALFSQTSENAEIADANELRVKETDRILETIHLLKAFGVEAEERPSGFIVKRASQLKPAHIDVKAEHRLAMTAAVLAMAAPGTSILDNFEIAEISYQGFAEDMQRLGARVKVEL